LGIIGAMDNKQAQFFPFHGINEYMLPDYRLHVIQAVFGKFDQLPGERRSALNGLVKRLVQVPGFRNSTQAPAGIKARSAVNTFERRPEFTAQVLQGWSELNPDLRQKVYEFLKAREWELLPPEADRTRLPGFLTEWPKGQDYDVLGQAFVEMYPGYEHEENDLRLMIVWLSGRLPSDMYEDEEEEGTEEE
jgi:hypothetical protein